MLTEYGQPLQIEECRERLNGHGRILEDQLHQIAAAGTDQLNPRAQGKIDQLQKECGRLRSLPGISRTSAGSSSPVGSGCELVPLPEDAVTPRVRKNGRTYGSGTCTWQRRQHAVRRYLKVRRQLRRLGKLPPGLVVLWPKSDGSCAPDPRRDDKARNVPRNCRHQFRFGS